MHQFPWGKRLTWETSGINMPLDMRENVYKPLVSYRILKKKKKKRVFSQKYCACFFLSKAVEARDKVDHLAWKHRSRCRSVNCVFVNIFSLSTSCSGWVVRRIDMEMNIPDFCLDICSSPQSQVTPSLHSSSLPYLPWHSCMESASSLTSPLQHLARWSNY